MIAPDGRPADLATLTSAEENDFVFNGIDCPDYWAIDGAGNNEGPNLGGFQFDKNSEPAGDWAWATGETWSYTNWTPGEPNNFNGAEDALTFFAQGNARAATWNDIGINTGSVIHYYVAESTDEQACVAPPAGMVSWWPGDDSANDIQGGNDGMLQGNIGFAPGKVLDGFTSTTPGGSADVGNPANLQLQNFTFDSWIKLNPVTLTGTGPAAITYQSGGGYGFGIAGPSQPPRVSGEMFLTQIGSSNAGPGPFMAITDANWHHIAVTKNNDTVIFYLDGVPSAPQSYNPAFSFSSDALIAASDQPDPVLYDEIEVFDRALTPQEIQAIVVADRAGKCKPAEGELTLTGVVSRKTHGTAGDFDLPLVLDPASDATVEPRTGGPTQLIFSFSDDVVASDGTLDADEFTITNAAFDSALILGNAITLDLTGVLDQSVVTVRLSDIEDTSGNPLSGDNEVAIRALFGDANQSRKVERLDLKLLRSHRNEPVNNSNFVLDLDLNGTVGARDARIIRQNKEHQVP